MALLLKKKNGDNIGYTDPGAKQLGTNHSVVTCSKMSKKCSPSNRKNKANNRICKCQGPIKSMVLRPTLYPTVKNYLPTKPISSNSDFG